MKKILVTKYYLKNLKIILKNQLLKIHNFMSYRFSAKQLPKVY